MTIPDGDEDGIIDFKNQGILYLAFQATFPMKGHIIIILQMTSVTVIEKAECRINAEMKHIAVTAVP